jgi:hypothetical protein
MFKYENVSNEIAASMQKELVSAVLEKRAEPLNKFASAVEALAKAAEIFDDLGLTKEAEYTTTLLEVVAGKKKPSKSKKKSKKPVKKTDPATAGLTGEKMVENLKEKGWVFNADDNDAAQGHSKGCLCSMCLGDVNDIRHGDDCVCPLCIEDTNDRYKMEADDCAHCEGTGMMAQVDRGAAKDDWNFADLFDLNDFEDEVDLPRVRRRV